MSCGLTYSRSVRPESRSPLANGVAPCLVSHLLIDPRSLTSFLMNVEALFAGERSHTTAAEGSVGSLAPRKPDLSNVAAGGLVELHANSVHRWRHRWACGNFSLADKAGGGGKPAFSPRDRAIVKAIACEAVSRPSCH